MAATLLTRALYLMPQGLSRHCNEGRQNFLSFHDHSCGVHQRGGDIQQCTFFVIFLLALNKKGRQTSGLVHCAKAIDMAAKYFSHVLSIHTRTI
jgi:hypothetical protein